LPKVSACVIAYQEEKAIKDCIDALSFCDEVIVVDSHSTDRTRQIATACGARVIEHDWEGHIAQKNYAVSLARNDWVLCVDADERVTPELREAIQRVLRDDAPSHDAYEVNRRTIYLGAWIKHGGWYPDRKTRLFHRRKARWGGVNPHDHVVVDADARLGRLDADLEHRSYEDVADHLKTIDFFSTISAREKLAQGQGGIELQLLFGAPFKFFKMFVLQGGFLDGWRGLIVATLGAFFVFLKYAKLWELVRVRGERGGTGERVTYGRKGESAPSAGERASS
jgi:glycosyltransferase involved in cell wall biosynthesis